MMGINDDMMPMAIMMIAIAAWGLASILVEIFSPRDSSDDAE
jgi:hypothetical protein